jgi:phosphatidylserine/phosphatidylglycerophosphate/cardiolipin synthase-like enzyme
MKQIILLLLSTFVFAQDIQVFFSPKGGCTDEICKQINKSEKSIYVMAYSFTSQPILNALLEAHKRKVPVNIIVDKSQRKEDDSIIEDLRKVGIMVMVDDKHAIFHNKVMVFDNKTIITGSFNFTKSAEVRNAENMLVIQDEELAKKYVANYFEHLTHAGAK